MCNFELQRVFNFRSENCTAGHGIRGSCDSESQVLFKHRCYRSA